MDGRNVGREFVGVSPCPNCFPKGSLVLTDNGLIPIEQIKNKNIKVLTTDNHFHNILLFHKNDYSGDLIEYYAYGMIKPLKCTPDHKLFVAEIIKGKHLNGYVEKQNECKNTRGYQTWLSGKLEAKELIGNSFSKSNIWIELPDIKPLFNKKIEDAFFLGLYCAEGIIHHNRTITFCLNKTTKIKSVNKIKEYYPYAKIYESKQSDKTLNVSVNNVKLIDRFKSLGRGCENKVVPPEILFNSNEESIAYFLEGVLSDGHFRKDGHVALTTTSMHLALQVSILLRRLKYHASINTYVPKKNNKKENCVVGFSLHEEKRHPNIRYINGKWYGKLKNAERKRKIKCKVYNLTIDKNHSYCVNGSMVKNCGDSRYHWGIHIEQKFGSCFKCKNYFHPIRTVAYYGHMKFEDAVKYLMNYAEDGLDVVQRVEQILKKGEREDTYIPLKKDPLPEGTFSITFDYIKRNRFLYKLMKEKKLYYWDIKNYDIRMAGSKSKFNGYLVFPVYLNGRIVSWQGRKILSKRYHNPENLGSYLYYDSNSIKDKPLILVEGIFDFIRIDSYLKIHYNNKINVTTGMVKMLSRYQIHRLVHLNPSRLIVMFDGDSWFDYNRIKNEVPFDVDYVILPKDKDPNMLSWNEIKTLLNPVIK